VDKRYVTILTMENTSHQINEILLDAGLETIEECDPCPERTAYLAHLEDSWEDAEKWEKKRKILETEYIANFYKYFASNNPHLLFETGEDKSYWNYNESEGVYEGVNFSVVRGKVIMLLMDEGFTTRATETTAKTILNRYRAAIAERGVSLDSFVNLTNILQFKNGWLDLKTLELTPHTPERLSLFKMAVDYDADITCSLYDKALDFDYEMPADQVRVIDQYSGYMLTNSIKEQQMLIFEGTTGCGKSTIPRIWLRILGKKGVTANLESLGGAEVRFLGEKFAHKNFCFFDEANPQTKSMNNYFTSMVDKDVIDVERKSVQLRVEVKNTLKIVLALNKMPYHQPDALDRRYRHIQFTKSFSDDGDADKDLLNNIVENELSGVLNRMIRGLHDYWKMGGMTMIAGEADRKREQTLAADDISAFVEEHFLPVHDSIVRYDYSNMKTAFSNEFSNSFNRGLSVRAFNKELKGIRLPEFKHISTGQSNGIRGYTGLELKSGHTLDSYGIAVNGVKIEDDF